MKLNIQVTAVSDSNSVSFLAKDTDRFSSGTATSGPAAIEKGGWVDRNKFFYVVILSG